MPATRPRRRSGRIPPRAPLARSPGLPLVVRLALVVAVVAFGFVVLIVASGALTRAVGGIGGVLSAAVAKLTPTAAPSAAPVGPLGAPVLETPTEPYTNQPTADVSGTVPGDVVGAADVRIRLYRTVGTGPQSTVGEQAVGQSVSFTFPGVALSSGTNTFTATILRGTSQSDSSPAIAYVLDTKAPPLTITAPANGATINRPSATITGRTQARSQILVRDGNSNASATAAARDDGTFSASIALDPGTNAITVTATDPAGNTKTATLTVRRGNGTLTASLSASRYRFSTGKLPQPLTVRVLVLDPDGKPLESAAVTFTISIPGVPTITATATTDATGHAGFATTIPKGATIGSGPAAVLVVTDEFGQATDRTVITIEK
jgi:hypothetical protein